MRRLVFHLSVFALLLAACGAPAPTAVPTRSDSLLPNTPTPVPLAATPSVTPPAPTLTPTALPSPVPSETLLPPLELPTQVVNPPALAVWDGLPTYLGDSRPGYYFRVRYNPELWALVTDQFGQPALGHRTIEYCMITPVAGRGLPPTVQMEHDVMYAGDLTFDVGKAYENGVLKFATYQASDGTIFTGFQVDFQADSEACINDAVAVLATLRSVPTSQATPQP